MTNTFLNPFAADIAAAAETTDMTKTTQGGGDYVPPPAGPCRLRFVGYVELGRHNQKGFQGAPDKVKSLARAFFEVSGPKHPPVERDGKKYPCAIVEVRLTVSLNEKAGFRKLFDRLNYAGKARHIAELLGNPYKGVLVHRKYKKADGTEGVSLDLKDDAGWTIQAPRVEDPDTGEWRTLDVAAPISPIRCLLWDRPSTQQWASIFIDGQRADGTSRNYLQDTALAALNYPGSALALLLGGGESVTGPVQAAKEEDADPFAGV